VSWSSWQVILWRPHRMMASRPPCASHADLQVQRCAICRAYIPLVNNLALMVYRLRPTVSTQSHVSVARRYKYCVRYGGSKPKYDVLTRSTYTPA
jgi:hypothetical protein